MTDCHLFSCEWTVEVIWWFAIVSLIPIVLFSMLQNTVNLTVSAIFVNNKFASLWLSEQEFFDSESTRDTIFLPMSQLGVH